MKTSFVLASVMVALCLAAPNKVEAQKRKAVAKVIEGTVIGIENTKYASRIEFESGGKRYLVYYGAREGRNPTVIGGDDYSFGMRVRVTYTSAQDAGRLLQATRIVRLDSRAVDSASTQTDVNGFQEFFTEFCSAVRKRDREALKLVMSSTIEFIGGDGQPSSAFDSLDAMNGEGWKQLEKSLATGTKPYQDSAPLTISRVTIRNGNLVLFERGFDGKWRWLRFLSYSF